MSTFQVQEHIPDKPSGALCLQGHLLPWILLQVNLMARALRQRALMRLESRKCLRAGRGLAQALDPLCSPWPCQAGLAHPHPPRGEPGMALEGQGRTPHSPVSPVEAWTGLDSPRLQPDSGAPGWRQYHPQPQAVFPGGFLLPKLM